MPPRALLQQGVSLVELLLVLAIAGSLALLAAPGFEAARRNAHLSAAVNELVGAMHYARSTAILRNVPTALCLSADGSSCLERAGVEARGWLLFVEHERRDPVQRNAADELLRTGALPGRVTVRGTRAAVTFWPAARAGTTATFRFCHAPGARSGRAVIVSRTGRPRAAAAPAGSGACTA